MIHFFERLLLAGYKTLTTRIVPFVVLSSTTFELLSHSLLSGLVSFVTSSASSSDIPFELLFGLLLDLGICFLSTFGLPLGLYYVCTHLEQWCEIPPRRSRRRRYRKIRKRWKRRKFFKDRAARHARLDQWITDKLYEEPWLPDTEEDTRNEWKDRSYRFLHLAQYSSMFADFSTQNPHLVFATLSHFSSPTNAETHDLQLDWLSQNPTHLPSYASDFQQLCDTISDFDLFLDTKAPLLAFKGDHSTDATAREAYWTLRSSPTYHALVADTQSSLDLADSLSVPSIYFTKIDQDAILIVDSGASVSITSSLSDFVSTPTPIGATLKGLTENTSLAVTGEGLVRWAVRDDHGKQHILETRAYHVPSARVRLFSPQTYLQKEDNPGRFTVAQKSNIFEFADGSKLSFPCDSRSNLPMLRVSRTGHDAVAFLREIDHDNTNLSEPQKELLKWHQKLGHFHCQ